jgi:3-ketosteroid 9alpha-monooxygenase subunit B
MSVSSPSAESSGVIHDRGYHQLRIKRIVRETDEASSFVLDIPAELQAVYHYESGQFLTFRATIEGHTVYRSYSMSSAPGIDSELAVTVKRVPGGAFSNWMNDTLKPGDVIEASAPSGVFKLGPTERRVVAFAAGSGVTPIYSIIKTALSGSERESHLLYANRDRDAVIFATELDELAAKHPERLATQHHLDVDKGFLDTAGIEPYVELAKDADCFICGPGPFMDLVETTLLTGGVAPERIHIERFTVSDPVEVAEPPSAQPEAAATSDCQITIELDGQTKTTTHHPGTTILQTARSMGMSPPFSCEMGSCATCMAKCVEGAVSMYVNDALFEDEVADGWILTCQSVPTTPTVHVVYGYEGA